MWYTVLLKFCSLLLHFPGLSLQTIINLPSFLTSHPTFPRHSPLRPSHLCLNILFHLPPYLFLPFPLPILGLPLRLQRHIRVRGKISRSASSIVSTFGGYVRINAWCSRRRSYFWCRSRWSYLRGGGEVPGSATAHVRVFRSLFCGERVGLFARLDFCSSFLARCET